MKLINCLDKVVEEEKRYLETLEKYSKRMAKEGIKVKYVLNKTSQRINGGFLIKYSGIRIVLENESRNHMEKLLLPPKFVFDGFEYMLTDDGAFCEYSVFRIFFKKLKCKYELAVNIEAGSFVKKLCSEAAKYVNYVHSKIGHDPQWIPLISSGILNKVSKRFKLKVNDAKDYAVYLFDTGILNVEFGESGELWLDYEGACLNEN